MAFAIAMWDFSWLERRWAGGGYEDWERALGELVERGYDSVRIDCYPHLVGHPETLTWELLPVWSSLDWGAPGPLTVERPCDQLLEFLRAARRAGVGVGLSSWYREDSTDIRRRLSDRETFISCWATVLDRIAGAGLQDQIVFVDLSNEFPVPIWTPYLSADPLGPMRSRREPDLAAWMRGTIAPLKAAHPGLAFCYSFTNEWDWQGQDVAKFDLLEPHLWMAEPETSPFYRDIGHAFDFFDDREFETIGASAEAVYRADRQDYDAALAAVIGRLAEWSRATQLPLVTTEAWAIINFKDHPALDWGWIREICDFGIDTAVRTGRWVGLCSSNFCGPQFHGMWQDVAWHRAATDRIRAADHAADLRLAASIDTHLARV